MNYTTTQLFLTWTKITKGAVTNDRNQPKSPLLILLLADVNRAFLPNQGCLLPSIKHKNYDSQTNSEMQTVINYRLQLEERPVREVTDFLYKAANPKQAW